MTSGRFIGIYDFGRHDRCCRSGGNRRGDGGVRGYDQLTAESGKEHGV